MTYLEPQYFSLNRILLLIVGLWPYQQSKFTRFQFILFSVILTTGIIFQFTALVTLKCTSSLITKILSSTSFFIISAIKYNTFCINIEAVKELLVQLQPVCSKLTDRNEVAIMEEYGCSARRYTIVLTIFAISSALTVIVGQYWSNILNVILSRNISRLRRLPIIMEYFIDQEKYFYFILLHINVVICIGCAVMLATGTLLITYLLQTCGMFRIASYRIEHAMNINMLRNVTLKNEVVIFKDITCAVNIHRQAMKLSQHLVSTFEIMAFCLIVCGVPCLSLNLFQIASLKNEFEEIFVAFLIVSFSILYMFLANYIGQNIIDHNTHVFATAYNVQWYRAPLHIQRMILFLLQREAKEFTLNVGGLFNASIECFATLVKTSVSYFTLIYSTR